MNARLNPVLVAVLQCGATVSRGVLVWISIGLAALTLPAQSWALILAEGDMDANTTAPPDDPGWANVGVYGEASATYVGNRWVVTADHVGFSPTVAFDGVAYDVIPGSAVQLTNPEGWLDGNGEPLRLSADLRMIRLAQDPGLPTLAISKQQPPFLDDTVEVLMIGTGRDRVADQTMWNLHFLEGTNAIWTEVEESPSDVAGYKYAPTRTKRWGTNTVFAERFQAWEDLDMDIIGLATQFTNDPFYASEFECQPTSGDSGGAVFYNGEGLWELVGIMMGVLQHWKGQPEDTAVFNANYAVFADFYAYGDQIEDVMNRLDAGDADQDRDFDQMDIVRVLTAGKYLTGEPATWGEGDWNGAPGGRPGDPPPGDGLFNQLDIVAALAGGHYLAGQGQAATFAATGPTETASPASRTDIEMWPSEAAASEDVSLRVTAEQMQLEFAPVPEPSTSLLTILAAVALAGWRLRTRPTC